MPVHQGALHHKDVTHFDGQREAFPVHAGWKVSKKGQPYIRLDNGYVITVYQREGNWSGAIYDPAMKKTIYAKRQYGSKREVQLAAYDVMQMLIEKRPT